MNGNCLDIGTIQAFLDGETRPDEAVRISDHVAECDACTLLLAQAEDESSLVYSVLDREMNTLVPTQRLWNRINESITEEKSRSSIWQRITGFVGASLLNPSFAAAAGLLLFVAIAGVVLLDMRKTPSVDFAAVQQPSSSQVQTETEQEKAPIAPFSAASDNKAGKSINRVEQTNYSDAELKKIIPATYTERGPKKIAPVQASAQYLPGEESYIKTIDELEQGVTAQNAGMKASSQVAFARDLAVVNDSINKMRKVVQKDPRNQAARQVLYSSYQDKIDLLRSSAQRDELMASLQ